MWQAVQENWTSSFMGTPRHFLYLNFARVGGLQSQGAKGEAVVGYREPLATLNLKSSGTPEG
jgi:hypothetical protein